MRGHVPVHTELIFRFDYGSVVPWVRRLDGRLLAIAGPDALVMATPVTLRGKGMTTQGSFVVSPGDRVPFVLTWYVPTKSRRARPIRSIACAIPRRGGASGRSNAARAGRIAAPSCGR